MLAGTSSRPARCTRTLDQCRSHAGAASRAGRWIEGDYHIFFSCLMFWRHWVWNKSCTNRESWVMLPLVSISGASMCRALHALSATAAPERRERSGYKVTLTAGATPRRPRARNRRRRAFVAARKNLTRAGSAPQLAAQALEQRMNRNRTAGLGRTREFTKRFDALQLMTPTCANWAPQRLNHHLAWKWRHKLLKSLDPRPGLARSLQQDQAADETAHPADTMRADWKWRSKLLKMRDSGTGLAGPSHCRTDEPSAGPRFLPPAGRPF